MKNHFQVDFLKQLKELANIELQLGMNSDPNMCDIRRLDEYQYAIDKMQWRKHILMYYEKHLKIILIILTFTSLIFFDKFGFYGFIPPILNIFFNIILKTKIKNNISHIKSFMYQISYSDIVFEKWLDDINQNGYFKHIIDKEILIKRKIKNYFIENFSVF